MRVLEGLKTGRSTLMGALVGDFVGALVGPLVGPLVVPLVGRGSLSPALCVAHHCHVCRKHALALTIYFERERSSFVRI